MKSAPQVTAEGLTLFRRFAPFPPPFPGTVAKISR